MPDPLHLLLLGSILLDLFIIYKSGVELLMFKGPMLDIMAKKSMLDGSAYQIKLDTNLPALGFLNLYSSSTFQISSQVFIWGPRNGSTFVSMYQHR